MGRITTLAWRELHALFFSPVAYVVGALVLLVTGAWFFAEIFRPGQEASLRPLFDVMAHVMILAAPLLTMRLISEEYHSHTDVALLTSPVTDAQVILGKYLGAMMFYLLVLAGTLVYLGLMLVFGRPDLGIAAMGYLGMILLGGTFLAAGLLASTLTKHQLVAAMAGAVFLVVLTLGMQVLVVWGPGPLSRLAGELNVMRHFREFSRGVLDSRSVVYLLSLTIALLYLSAKSLESRRWR